MNREELVVGEEYQFNADYFKNLDSITGYSIESVNIATTEKYHRRILRSLPAQYIFEKFKFTREVKDGNTFEYKFEITGFRDELVKYPNKQINSFKDAIEISINSNTTIYLPEIRFLEKTIKTLYPDE